jgi:hypothetical protein
MGGAGGSGGTGICVPGSTAPCYSGPEGTENKGICAGGTKTCNAGGTGYGACVGEVTPKVEDCATPEDEDCDGLSPACKGNLLWSRRFGGAQDQIGQSIAVDEAGAVLVAGHFYASVDFGAGPLSSAGYEDSFLCKLDAAGNSLWSRRFGGPGDQLANSVAVDGSGAAFVAGVFAGSIDFGGGPLTSNGGLDVFLAKFDAAGNLVWSKRFGDASDQTANGIAVDGSGNVIVGGYFYGTIDFGGAPLTNVNGENGFIAKLDTNGSPVWSKSFHGNGDQVMSGIAASSTGEVFATGRFFGSADFGGGDLPSAGGADAFLVKLSAAGDHVWSKHFGDAADQAGSSVAVDSAGNVIVTGSFDGSVNLGGNGVLQSMGSTDLFVAKFDTAGAFAWGERFGDAGNQPGSFVAADKNGNVLVSGFYASAINFGDGPHASAGSYDIFLAKLDANGNNVWGKSFGDKNAQEAYGLAVDGSGNALITGAMAGAVDFGSGPLLTSAGGNDIFVAKFTP